MSESESLTYNRLLVEISDLGAKAYLSKLCYNY
jgi:hypothetical protein